MSGLTKEADIVMDVFCFDPLSISSLSLTFCLISPVSRSPFLSFSFPSLGLCSVCRQCLTTCDWAPRQASRLSPPQARPMATSTTPRAPSVSSHPRPETSPWARPSTTHCWYCSTYHSPTHACTKPTHSHKQLLSVSERLPEDSSLRVRVWEHLLCLWDTVH